MYTEYKGICKKTAKTTAPLLGKVFIVIKRVRASRGIWKNPEQRVRETDRQGHQTEYGQIFLLKRKDNSKKEWWC